MFKSLFNLAGNIVDIAIAPVRVVAATAELVTKPIADMCNEVAAEAEDLADDDQCPR